MNAEVAALADPKTPTRERPSNGAWPRGARRPGSGSRRTARVEADAEVGTATSSPPTWSNWEIFKSGSRANLDGAIRQFNLISYCRVEINTRCKGVGIPEQI